MFDYVDNKVTFSTKNKRKSFLEAVKEADEEVSKLNEHLVDSTIPICVPETPSSSDELIAIKKITLKTIAINDLLKTFDDYKAELRAIFDERKTILDRFNRGNRYDYLTILSRIVTSTQQQQMYCRICEEFAEKNYIESLRYENLFWTILLPEWLIEICSNQFSLSKTQVVAQIKMDDEDSINGQNSFDLDL